MHDRGVFLLIGGRFSHLSFDTRHWSAGSAIHLMCRWHIRGVVLWWEKSGPPYKPPSVPSIFFCLAELFGLHCAYSILAVKSYGQICQDTMLFKASQWYVKLDTLIYYILCHFTFLFRFYHIIKRLYCSFSASYMCSWTTKLALSGLQFTIIFLCLYTATQLDLQLNIRVFAYLDS